MTRYRPLPGENQLARHVDGRNVHGSVILGLHTDEEFTGGGVTVRSRSRRSRRSRRRKDRVSNERKGRFRQSGERKMRRGGSNGEEGEEW